MPINKFNGFYYGVGMKLDEKSINEMSSQLESKLNKTVAKVTKEMEALQKALASGASSDFGPLVKSLNEAAAGLHQVDGANFEALKAQVEQLEGRFDALDDTAKKIGKDLTDVTTKFDGLIKGLSETMERYMQQPKVMRDNLKQDLKNMTNMASSYAEVLKLDPNADTSGLAEYFAEFKRQFQGISDLSDLTTKEIAEGFFKLGDALRQLGAPFDEIRLDLTQMTSQLQGAFEVKNEKTAKNIFGNMGYQADLLSKKVQEGQKQVAELQEQLARLSGLASGKAGKFNGGTLASDDNILSLEQQISKIEAYDDQLQSLEMGSTEWESIFQRQMSLIRHVEKELAKLGENGVNKAALEQWRDFYSMFTGADYEFGGEKLGDSIISAAIAESKEKTVELNKILETQSKELQKNKANLTKTLEGLLGVQTKAVDAGNSKKNKNKVQRNTLKTQLVELVQEVELKAKINEKEWKTSVNNAIANISSKIKPIDINVKIKNVTEIKKEIQAIKSAQLITDGTKKTGKNAGTDKDAETFNKRFENLKKTIEGKKKELATELRDWHDQFDKMFEFQFKVNGLKKGEYGNLAQIISDLVDDINAKLEGKPLKFESNIEELVGKINEQLKNIKIDELQVGGISAGGISAGNLGTGGAVLPGQIIQILNGAGVSAGRAAQKFEEAGEAARNVGKNAQDGTAKPNKSLEQSQVDALLQAYKKLTEKQRESLGKKSPELIKAMASLEKNPTWDNYREQILQFADMSRTISGMTSKAKGVTNFLDLLKADIKSYEQMFGKPVLEGSVYQRDQRWFENGKQIVEYIIQLAEMAAKISPLRSKPGFEITEKMFQDGELSRWISGRQVSKDDIGAVIGKKDVTDADVDKFLTRMGMTRNNLVGKTDKNFAQYLNPLLEAINNFKEKQETLTRALAQLQKIPSMGKFTEGFALSDDKTGYLADQLKWLKTIVSTGGKTKGQEYILDTFKNNNIDISALKNAQSQKEQWKIIQDQILDNPQVNFNKLMNDLRSGKDSFGQSYKDFVEIIGIAQRFVTESKALSEVGKVANTIVSGEKGTITRQDGTEKKVIVQAGLRDVLNQFGIVIRDQDGSTFGYRAGKETVESGLFGRNEPFSQIAKQLATALERAAEIAFSKNRIDGLDVKKYEPYKTEPKSTYGSNVYENRNLASNYIDYYTQQANILGNRLKAQETNYKALINQDGYQQQYLELLNKKLKENSKYLELKEKQQNKTATIDEKNQLLAIIENASKELAEQAKRLETSKAQTKQELEAVQAKLKQKQNEYKQFNADIKKKEKELSRKQPKQAVPQKPQSGEKSQGQQIPSGGQEFYTLGSGTGGVILSGQADIATETTVRAIYDALVGNNGSDNNQLNSQIEALEKTIYDMEAAAKAAQEKQKKVTPKKKEPEPDKKTAERVKNARAQQAKKQAEEEKKAEEERRKAVEAGMSAKKAESEAARKAEEEATRKAAEAAAKKAEEEARRIAEEARVIREREEAAKKSQDAIQQSYGKSQQELFQASKKYLGEVNAYMKIFREHTFTLENGIVNQVAVGTHSKGGLVTSNQYDTYGHTHPQNSLYSGQDLSIMRGRKSRNASYDKDVLLTPDYKFELTGVKKISNEVLGELASTFDYIFQQLGSTAPNELKASILKAYSQKYGFGFSAHNFGENGQLIDITEKIPAMSEELVKFIVQAKELANKEKQIQAKYKDHPREALKDKDLTNIGAELHLLEKKILASDDYKNILSTYKLKKASNYEESMFFATRFQDALDFKWDLAPLAEEFENFMRYMSQFENKISQDSAYFKIKESYEQEKSKGTFNGQFLNNVRPLLKELFGFSTTSGVPDERFFTGYSRMYGDAFNKKYPNWENSRTYGRGWDISDQSVDTSLPELKAELARLKAMRDSTNVRFATQEKQEEIISILKSGVKVEGTDGKGGSKDKIDDDKKKNLSVGQQAKQAQDAIGKMSQEASVKIDSTGKETINTIKKIGAETAKVTQITEDGVTKSTLELSNQYEMAMKSLFQKIRGDSGKYLFGAETVRFGVETTEAQDALLKYVDTYRKLEEAMEQYKRSGDILLVDGPNKGKQLQTVIDDLQVQLGQYEQRLVSISNTSQSFLGGKAPFAMLDGAQVKDATNSLKLLAMSTEPLGAAFNGVYNNGKKLLYDVLDNGIIKSYSLEVDEATGNVRKMEISQTALVNALQNVNKAAKQGKELKSIFINDDVNKDSTVIQNYKNAYKEMNDYVRQVWETARQNGGLIPIDEQNKIYAMSQEVLRLGATIQNEYKKIANFRDSGGMLDVLRPLSDSSDLETQMMQYLNKFAEGQTAQFSNVAYDSITKSMTADLVGLSGEITKVKLQYNEMFNAVQVMSAKETTSIDKIATEMNKLGDSISTAIDAGVINKNMSEYQAYETELVKLDKLISDIQDGTIAYNYDAMLAWQAQRKAVVDTGNALAEIAKKNAQKSLPGVRAVESQSTKKMQIDNSMEQFNVTKDTKVYAKYAAAYEELIKLREKFRAQGTLGLEETQKLLQVEADKVRLLGTEVEKLINKTKQGVGAVTTQSNKKIQIDNAIANTNVGQSNKTYLKYVAEYEKLIQLMERFKSEGTLGLDENQKALQVAADKVRVLGGEVEKLISTSTQIMSTAKSEDDIKYIPDLDRKNIEAEMQQFAGITADATNEQWKFNSATNEATYVLKGTDNVVHEMSMRYDELNHVLVRTEKQHYKVKTAAQKFWDSMSGKLQEVGKYLLSFGSIYQVWGWVRQGITYIREIDSAMAELKKVTDETTRSYREFENTASSIAKTTGSTMSAVISSAADWARLGYDLQQATELSKNTSMLMNISEFDDISKATDSMISALQAFKQEGVDVADLSTQIIDAYNEVGNSYAISTSDLASSLTRSSASLVAAGNSLSEAIALTTAANTITQDPDSVGNALKVVSMRVRGTSAKEIAAAGEETDGLISSTSKLATKIQELTSIDGEGGVKILTDTGAYKSTYAILLEISKVWDKMNDMDQAALLELIAGKQRGSVVAGLLQNGDLLEDVFESAENSAGSALEELQVHLDSIEGKIQQLTNSIQTMWNNFLDDAVVKGFVDFLRHVVELGDKIGLLNVAFGAWRMVGGLKSENNDIKVNNTADKLIDAVSNAVSKLKGEDKSGANNTAKPNPLKDIGADRAIAQGAGEAAQEAAKGVVEPTSSALNAGAQQIENAGTTIQSAANKIDNAAGRIETAVTRDTNNSAPDVDVNDQVNTPNISDTFDEPEYGQQLAFLDDVVDGSQEAAEGIAEVSDAMNDVEEASYILDDQMSFDDMIDGSQKAAVGQQVLEVSHKKTTGAMLAQKVVAAGLKIGLAALQGIGMMLAGMLLTKLVQAFQEASQRMNDLKEKAIQASDTLKENQDTVNDYKEEINDLRATLADYTTSEQDAYDARVRLMEIQDDIINKYGKEAEGINLVTGSIKEQIAAIDELDKKNANAYITEYAAAFSDAQRQLDKKISSSFTLSEGNIDASLLSSFEDFMSEKGFKKTVQANSYTNGPITIEAPDSHTFRAKDSKVNFDGIYDEVVTWIGEKAAQGYDVEHLRKMVSSEMERMDFDNEDYQQNLEVYNDYVEQKVLADYTSQYKAILDAEGAYKDAVISGDTTTQSETLKNYKAALEAAAADAKEQYMKDYFNDQIKDIEDDIKKIDFMDAVKNNSSDQHKMAKNIQSSITSSGLTKDDILEMNRLNEAGGLDGSGYAENQIQAFKDLKVQADAAEISVDDVTDALVQLGYVKVSPDSVDIGSVGKSLDILSSANESYQNAMIVAQEIAYDNMQISEDYYTQLADYLSDYAEFNEAVNTENGEYIVTNSKLIKDLIKLKNKERAADVRLSRSQAKLKYYELYKRMRELTGGYKQLKGSALEEINTLFDQMSTIEKTIAKYSLLEAKLLGTTNAYTDLAAAQEADSEIDYGSQAEELVNVLGNAFNTAELGTEAAQVAIKGLIPDDVIDKSKTLDDQMQQIYDYFTDGTISKLFTIEFDDDGGISSVEMTKENIEEFTKSLIGSAEDGAVFQGTWDEFTLNPAITSLADFANAIDATEEVAFAFLSSLEKYDISWLGGDMSTLLDQLMGDDLEHQLYDKMQKIADLEMKIANGSITSEETSTYGTLIGEMETLEEQALKNATKWGETSNALENAKAEMIDLNKQLEETDKNSLAYFELKEKIEKAQDKTNDLVQTLEELGEPTELTLTVAADEVQEQIDEFKADLDELVKNNDQNAIELQAVINEVDAHGMEELGVYKDEHGVWVGMANIKGYSSLDSASKQDVLDYLDLINGQHTIDALMGDGVVTVEQHLENIASILEKTYTLLLDTSQAQSDLVTFKDLYDSLKSKEITITQKLQTIGEFVRQFFADGTAHAVGTAHAHGSWGAPKTETALVGELGPELLVRGNRWTTVGDNGAEFTQVKKGDIIFNHKQTEDLLSKGYVTSRGRLHGGSALASGTAYSINTWDDAYGNVHKDYSNIDAASNSLSGAASDISDAADEFKEVFDWIEVRLEEVNERISYKGAQLENQIGYKNQNEIVVEMIKLNEKLYDNLEAGKDEYNAYAKKLLSKIPEEYQIAAQNGAIAIETFIGEVDEKTLEAIQNYREWAQKAADVAQQVQETIIEISALAKQAIDNIATQFENEASLRGNKSDQLNAYNALLETTYGTESEEIYKALIKINKTNIEELEKQRDAMQKQLNAQVEAGNIQKYSQDWYDAVNDIAALDTEIIELRTDLNDLQDAINEIHWYYFDLLMSQFEAVSDEAENLTDILTTKDVVDEMGNWTDEGITVLGLYAQQMEVAEVQVEKYAKEIEYLNQNWKSLGYTEEEYLDKLEELKSGQYDAIKAYNDTKDAIVDLNSERVDAIKEGIEKEIEAYEELIEKKKEELDAEKDLYDFQKSVMEQEKDIADIQRQLTALSADNSASARAKRAQLEAELAKAQAELEESYYDRSISNQQEALDKELENFQEEKDAEIEGWEKYLEDTNQVVADSLATVQTNTDTVYQTLDALGQEYSLSITEALISPWNDGAIAIQNYTEQFKLSMSSTVEELKALSAQYDATIGELHSTVEDEANKNISSVESSSSAYQKATEKKQSSGSSTSGGDKTSGGSSATAGLVSSLSGNIQYGNTGDKVKKLQQALNELGYGNSGTSGLDGIFGDLTLAAVKKFQKDMKIAVDGIVGPETKNKFKVKGYAKGSKGLDEDQWALIDELGEELILRAHNGRLTYMEKDTGIIPADLTSNLMGWGKLDPSIMLDQNRPSIGVHPEISHTEIQIDNSIAELIHIDHCDQSTLPDVEKIVNNALEKHTQRLNQSLRKYTR